MKLFTKYNRINVLLTVIIFLLGCVAFSVLLRYVIISQIDEDLRIEKNEIVAYAKQNDRLPAIIQVHDQHTIYQPITSPQLKGNKIYSHKLYDSIEHHKELRRIIQFNLYTNNSWFLIRVSKSLEGTNNLIQTIIAITISIILLILAATFFINRIVLRRLWKPFYETLNNMQQFTLSDAQTVSLSNTNIDEFNYLNSKLSVVLNKAQQDYQTLKEFTENASHELQTPLAVIQSKLDVLIQNEKLSEAESQNIQSAYTALKGLSKLNQSLLLLAKIDNKQFSEKSAINFLKLIENKISQFNDLWKSRNIIIHSTVADKTINANFYLVEILLNNLLSNATKHNINNGSINILLKNNLEITNTGIDKKLDETMLFKRFSKQDHSSSNHGLGLSIIYRICQVSGFNCSYNFAEPNLHTFTITF